MPLRQFLPRKFKYLIDFNQAQKIEILKEFHFTSSPLIVIIKIEQWTDCSCWENSIYKRKDPTNGLVFFKTEKNTVAFYCTFILYRQISKKNWAERKMYPNHLNFDAKNKDLVTFCIVWKSLKMSHFNFKVGHFPLMSGNTVRLQASGLQKIIGFCNELLSSQNENVARFARNVKWDFFYNFQTPCVTLKNQGLQ